MGGNPVQIFISFGTANTGAAPIANATLPTQIATGLLTGNASPAGLPGAEVVIVTRNPLPAGVLSELRTNFPKELGNLRIIVADPSLSASHAGIPLEVGDLTSLQTLLSNPAVLMEAVANQAEMFAAANLLLGSQNVFAGPGRGAAAETPQTGFNRLSQAASQTSTPAREAAARTLRGSHAPAATGRGAPASGTRSAQHGAAAAAETARLPQVVRDVLIRLQILPPGVSTEQALPRLQEVVRLWASQGAEHADLPADVVRVVSNFLASAVLASALPGRSGAAPRAGTGAEASQTATNQASNPLFRNGGEANSRFANLTHQDIAKAVLGALNQTGLFPSSNSAATPRGTAQPQEAAHQAPAAGQPGTTPVKGAERENAQVQVRLAEAARPEAGVDRNVRDARPLTRMSGDEYRERTELDEARLDERRVAHDQESHPGSDEEENEEALESLWRDLQEALEEGGFVTADGQLRELLDAVEGRSFLRLASRHVPKGWDLIDVLAWIDARTGLAAEAGAVNAALQRLSSYRKNWNSDKVRAVLEPLHDAFVVLEMVDADLVPVTESEISANDLKGFETHASAARMLLDNPAWMSRMGADDEERRDLERIIPDIERLVNDVEEKFSTLIPAIGPEYFASNTLPH